MRNRRWYRVMMCFIVSVVLAVAPVTYAQNLDVINLEEAIDAAIEETLQGTQQVSQKVLTLKPGVQPITLAVGDVLDEALLRQYVQYTDGTSPTDEDRLYVTFLRGDTLFENNRAIAEGKARIRIGVETPTGEQLKSKACIDICIEGEQSETEEETVTHMPYIYGYPDGTFRPERGVTREELASMVSRLLLAGKVPTDTNRFPDVSPGRYSAANIAHLDALGIMKGYADGTFRPYQEVTRAEMAVVIERTLKYLEIPASTVRLIDYADVPKDYWAYQAIQYVTENGYMEGSEVDGKRLFRPNDKLTRAEAVIILNKVFNRTQKVQGLENPYSDLTSDYYAYEAILNASVPHTHTV